MANKTSSHHVWRTPHRSALFVAVVHGLAPVASSPRRAVTGRSSTHMRWRASGGRSTVDDGYRQRREIRSARTDRALGRFMTTKSTTRRRVWWRLAKPSNKIRPRGARMGNEFKGQAAHSAEHFGDIRDHWWNRDYLEPRWEAMEIRCRPRRARCRLRRRSLGDVARVGDARLRSVSPASIASRRGWRVARARANSRGLGGRFSYRQGEAQRLPFPDESFDLDDPPDFAHSPA